MADLLIEGSESSVRPSRPSLAQVRALIDFIQKHPEMNRKKLPNGIARLKIKKLWIQVSNIVNSLEGTLKSTKGWTKFWSDKKRSIILKQKEIDEGKGFCLTPLEQKIYDLCQSDASNNVKSSSTKRKKSVKVEPCNGDDDHSMNNLFSDSEDLDLKQRDNSRLLSTEAEERQLNIMEKLVDVMDEQAQAMAQMAQATHSNSKALDRLAEASHIQALAVDRVASTFENINSSVHDVRNAIMSIDYTMKRCYPTSVTQHRQNSNLFS